MSSQLTSTGVPRPTQGLIIGGGIGGLTLAVALKRAGLAYEVFERETEFRPAGAGLILNTAPMRALQTLGLDHDVLQVAREIEAVEIHSAEGTLLQQTETAFLKKEFGQPTIAIHRAALQAVLLQRLGGATVRMGKKLRGYTVDETGVTARFEDGSTARGRVLVGADGLRSAVRHQLLGDSPLRYAGYSTYRGIASGFGTVPPNLVEMWGRGVRFGLTPIAGGEVYWFAVFNTTEGDASVAPKRMLANLFGGFASPAPELIAATPEGRMIRADIHDRLPAAIWSRGPVTLLGDAAHPTTPNLGQGAGMAIEDAVVLAHHLAATNNDHQTAFKLYEGIRLAKANNVVNRSWQFGRLAQMDGAISTRIRNLAVRSLPAPLAKLQLRQNAEFKLYA